MELIEKVEHFLNQNMGWKIEIDAPSFDSKMSRITQELECRDSASCIQYIESHPMDNKVIQALAREFSVGESYFFRDLAFFDTFEHIIIPQIIAKNDRSLSIWSVGCSHAEELYSVAMMVGKMIPYCESWNLYLLGTDINPDALNQAKEGIFNQYSFRQMPEEYRNYFECMKGNYRLHPEIQKMAHFKYHNIMDEVSLCLPPDGRGFDLILLNNVLIYFEIEKAKQVVEKLFSLLNEGGWLATTATEYSMGIFDFPHSQCIRKGYCIQKVSIPTVVPAPIFVEQELNIYEEVATHRVQSSENNNIERQKLNEDKECIHYHSALKMLESGDIEGAKVALRQALYQNNGLIMAHVILGNILKKEGKSKASMKHISNAKMALERMQPQEVVELSDGIMASDLLTMLNTINSI
ncbi:MAG: CheR family methyltransferase [Sulfurimonas sp.]|jgi:chemotaxis protein methyltransferase CheR